jgi:cephalosporin hydroxylase
MKITFDTDNQTIFDEESGETLPLYSSEGFKTTSKIWLKVGWNEKYVYTFSWMGRPIIQLPEDMIRLQELIFQKRPDVIIETGIAHGGSLIYSASLMKIMGINGRVIGVDIEIRPHNRQEIEKHFLFPYITLIEGNSASENVVKSIKSQIKNEDTVLIILDSNHSREHVLAELEAYCSLVTPGSYIIATDGIMQDVYDVPRGMAEWKLDNPITAVRDFLSNHQEFILEPPQGIFNESALDPNINTHWRNAWLKRA